MLFTYLLFYKHWNLYIPYANHSFPVQSNVLPFFITFLFLIAIVATISHLRFAFLSFDGLHSFFSASSVGVDDIGGYDLHVSTPSLVSMAFCFISIS